MGTPSARTARPDDTPRPRTGASAWRTEAIDVVRAVSGGLLFGVPLLYTMEVWQVGSSTPPEQTLVVLGLLAVPVLLLNLSAGFRTVREIRVVDAAAETVEALAIGLLTTFGVLVILRQIGPDTPLSIALGKVVYEAVPFCLGIGVARLLLEGDPGLEEDTGGAVRRANAPPTGP